MDFRLRQADIAGAIGELEVRLLRACQCGRTTTPWMINMEPENDGLEDDFPFQLGGF